MRRNSHRPYPNAVRPVVAKLIWILTLGIWAAGTGLVFAAQGAQQAARIECQGMVLPQARYLITLNPGESVQQVHVQTGQVVQAGDLLVTLSNDQAVTGLAELMLKQKSLQEAAQELQLLKLELKLKNERHRALLEKIASEKQLLQQLPAQSSDRQLEPLLTRQLDLEEQIKLMTARAALMQQRDRSNADVMAMLDNRIQKMRGQIEALMVKAPFSGVVAAVSDYPQRLTAGQMILDLWDNSQLSVKARVLQHQLEHIHLGDRAQVLLDFAQRPALPAVVQRILPSDLAPSGDVYPTFGVILKVDAHQKWLRPGMKVSVYMGAAEQP